MPAGQNAATLMRFFDRDGNGTLEPDEFRAAVRKGGGLTSSLFSDAEVQALFALIDADGSGSVDVLELSRPASHCPCVF